MTFDEWIEAQEPGIAACDHLQFGRKVWRAAQNAKRERCAEIDETAVRERFESWITQPPFEKRIERYGDKGAWPGNYCAYDVQLAWCAWEDSENTERESCAACAEDTAAGRDAEAIAEAIRKRSNA